MGQYLGGFKSGINFVLEPEWAYIWVGLYSRFYIMSISNQPFWSKTIEASKTFKYLNV